MSNTDSLSTQLMQFSNAQLGGIKPVQITRITVHLILTTAFFSGALLHFAKTQKKRKTDYLPILIDFLANTFSLTQENAAGMVESNARMYKRYVLVEKVYQQGWSAAQQWPASNGSPNSELQDILQRYQQLSMSSLDIEGVKEIPEAPAEIEALIPQIEPVAAAKKSYWGWLLALLLTASLATGYFFFFR